MLNTYIYWVPGACDPLTAALADEETVAGAADVLAAGRGVPDGRGLVAHTALDNMLQHQYYTQPVLTQSTHLILLAADVDHVAAHPAAHHGHAPSQSVVGRRQLVWTNGRDCCPGPRAGDALRPLARPGPQQGLPLHVLGHLCLYDAITLNNTLASLSCLQSAQMTPLSFMSLTIWIV